MKGKEKLSVSNLKVSYSTKGQETHALANVDLTIKDGEFVSVVGPSGCGKSTLLKVIANLIKPTEGSVLIDGKPININSDVGMVFQNDALLPWKSVYDNVRMPLAIENKTKQVQQETASKFIDMVGLSGFEDFYPKQLSGGMKKRVALARAFVFNPSIYLMDEPFGPLDAQTRVNIGEEFLKMWESVGKSVLFITHDIEEAIALSDRVLVMSNRPGYIKESFKVPLKRPRPFFETRFEPAFQSLQKDIWECLEEAKQETGINQ